MNEESAKPENIDKRAFHQILKTKSDGEYASSPNN